VISLVFSVEDFIVLNYIICRSVPVYIIFFFPFETEHCIHLYYLLLFGACYFDGLPMSR
jgi:hypothetical protein